jgi:hypothetical protein
LPGRMGEARNSSRRSCTRAGSACPGAWERRAIAAGGVVCVLEALARRIGEARPQSGLAGWKHRGRRVFTPPAPKSTRGRGGVGKGRQPAADAGHGRAVAGAKGCRRAGWAAAVGFRQKNGAALRGFRGGPPR